MHASSARVKPKVSLWAWERTEDLRFLASAPKYSDVSVYFLAKTLGLHESTFSIEPRRHPLYVAPETPLMAVVRIESERGGGLPWKEMASPAFIDALSLEIQQASELPRVLGVQIDFDAPPDARDFYRALLQGIKRRLKPEKRLEMTSLAAWCFYGSWLTTEPLPVDLIAPMAFSMGKDRELVDKALALYGHFPVSVCNLAFGFSVEEHSTLPRFVDDGSAAQQVSLFAFSKEAWTQKKVDAVLDKLP